MSRRERINQVHHAGRRVLMMVSATLPTSDRAVRAFEAVLPPGTRVKTTSSVERDACVSVAGQRLRLRWLPVGWPRQLAEALQVKPRPDIVAARQLSPGARALAARERVGWVDESGAAEISAGTILISRTGSPLVPLDLRVGWRPATLAVCDVVLTGCPATVSAVVAATGLSMSSAATALKFLAGQGFLTCAADRGHMSRRQVADSDGLVDAYAAAAAGRGPASVRCCGHAPMLTCAPRVSGTRTRPSICAR